MECDLSHLDDTFFEIHEYSLKDEKELFTLDKEFEKIMTLNEKARFDGVIKVRVPPELRKVTTNWEEFFSKAKANGNGTDELMVQFLTVVDDPVFSHAKSVMHCHNASFQKPPIEFYKRLPNLKELLNPTDNCCSELLKQNKVKEAVKHFYETLQNKSISVPCTKPTYAIEPNTARKHFNERQKIMEENLPSVACLLIEKNMKTKTYADEAPGLNPVCPCTQCQYSRGEWRHWATPATQIRENLKNKVKADGDGDDCSVYLTDLEENRDNFLYITPNFALSYLCHANMLTDLPEYYNGVSFPYLYFGGLHSFFALHIEDMSLPSFNYLHLGHCKIWIVVSPTEITKLSYILTYYCMSTARSCIFKLSHKDTLITPQLLLHHDIKFKIIIQEPGDFILLAPNAPHTGGNTGPNLAEACNLGTVHWLPYGSVSSTENCPCSDDNKIHMDITPLIKMHKKELYKFHESRTMAENYPDEFFKKSIIRFCSSSAALPDTVGKIKASTSNKRKAPPHHYAPPAKKKIGTQESL